MSKPPGRTLDQFLSLHDPRHVVAEAIEERYDQPTPKGCKVFLITAAQNSTPLHKEFWAILRKIAEHRKAQLLVVPLRYKNPTSTWLGSQKNADFWDVPTEYRQNVRKVLNPNLTLLADVKTQPTAKDPLTGFDAMSMASSGIVAHTKLQMRCIPTPSNRMAKILTTTGACTVQNYSDTKAGKIGEFHHSLSALIVELDGPRFHLRQLHYHAGTGSVTDGARGIRYSVTPVNPGTCSQALHVSVGKAPRPLALASGDTHVDFQDPQVNEATERLLAELDPEYDVEHDLLDAYSCNPHHLGNPFNAVAKRKVGADIVEAEVARAIEFVRRRAQKRKVLIVSSNHDNMLLRWIMRADWKSEPHNALFYLDTARALVAECKITERGTEFPDPFVYWIQQAKIENVVFAGESFTVGGVELAMHGDKGPNGARGSIRNLRRIGVKSIIGHSHSPGIDEGCYQSGTSTRLRLEYNHGASGWLNAHVLLQADGKRQILIIVDGRYKN
jgi:hypothetical protein